MGSASIFRRIAKHGVSPVRDAREDRLTEVWAAILDSSHCAGFARHVALDWLRVAANDATVADRPHVRRLLQLLSEDGEWRCDVATQVPATVDEERRRPDMTLTFTGPAPVSLWIEIKNGTAPHTGQLSAYRRIQRERGLANSAVLLVAPRADYAGFVEAQLPPEVPRLSWEQTAQSIRSLPGRTDDAVREFLLEELWKYMRDEDLTDPEELTPAHVAALRSYADARRALERLCDLAAGRVKDAWGGTGERGIYPERGEPRQYWWSHQTDRAGRMLGADWWWDWKLLMDSTDILKDGDRRPGVFVGVTGTSGALGRLDDASKEAAAGARFVLLGPGASNGRHDYVLRYAPLDHALVGDGALDTQGQTLAHWLIGSLRDLEHAVAAARVGDGRSDAGAR